MTAAPTWQKWAIALALLLPGGLALTGCYLLARGWKRALDRMLK